MSSSESTAINALINVAHQRPVRDSSEDLLFEAPRPARPREAPPMFVVPVPQLAPPPPPFAAPPPRPRALFPVELPSEPTEARATMPVISVRKQVFEPTPRNYDSVATIYVAKQIPLDQALKKLAIPMVGLIVAGLAIGGIVALTHRSHDHITPPLAAAALPIAASAPAPVIAAPPVAKPALVAIRLDSSPPGASATLVDNGTSTPLGSTPVDAAVDPSKSYDVVFSLEGRTTKIEHLDPTATNHLEVALVEPVAPVEPVAAAPEPAPAPAPVVAKAKTKAPARHHHAPTKQAARVAAAAPHSPAPVHAAKAPATGNGTLMVSTTPPCAILIDGKNTGLTSPQAAIALPPGSHQVRLIAAGSHVNKLVAIEIVPGHATKVVQTFDN